MDKLTEKVLMKKILNKKISNQRAALKNVSFVNEEEKIKLENSIKNLEDKRDALND
ncbi:hypothetical protein MKX66_28925 [Bacillus sp. FSL R9-9530]|uniref:hypothetical protein n=1 Tax=Bacillus sp. FSL R9-9530 TaxID=2921593 RepID=UPI002E1D49E2|nr:hypothetical protein [Bacillus thuringiensis]